MAKDSKYPLTHSDLMHMHDVQSAYFFEKWQNAAENERYKRAEHWSESQRQEIAAQDRIAYSIGLAQSKLNQFLSEERLNRTSWVVEATQDPNDEIKAEIATIQLRDVESRSDMVYLQSDVYDSGLTACYGVAGWYLKKDIYGNDLVCVEEVDYRDLIWDANATSYSKNEGLFMARRKVAYRYQLEEIYGKSKVNDLTPGDDITFMPRQKREYWLTPNTEGKSAYDIISVFQHYQKVLRDYYYVVFSDPLNIHKTNEKVIIEKFRSKKKADMRIRELKAPYFANFGIDPGGDLFHRQEEKLDLYHFNYQEIFEYEETELDLFPYSIYQAFHFKDQFWTLTDILKDPQKWIDRLFSQIDYAFGQDINNVLEIIVNNLAEGLSFEDAVQRLQDGLPIPVKSPNTISTVSTKGASPQWMEMAAVLQKLIEDMSGGRSFQGLNESAGESGRAINLKMQQGQLISLLFRDNLMRWKRDLGKKVLWACKHHDTAERIVRLGGGELSDEMLQVLQQEELFRPSIKQDGSGYLKINHNDQGLHFLRDDHYELKVSEESLSETMRDKRLAQYTLAEQQDPQLAMSVEWRKIKLKAMGIPYADRMKLIKELEQMQKQAAIDAEFQRRLGAAKVMQAGYAVDVRSRDNRTQVAAQAQANKEKAKAQNKKKPTAKK